MKNLYIENLKVRFFKTQTEQMLMQMKRILTEITQIMAVLLQ